MGLDEIKRQQEESKRLAEIDGRVQVLYLAFHRNGLPDICRKVQQELTAQGVNVDWTRKEHDYWPPYDEDIFSFGKIEVPGTDISVDFRGWGKSIFNPECVEWTHGQGMNEDYSPKPYRRLYMSTQALALPIDLKLSGGKLSQCPTFLWKDTQDNARLAQSVVKMVNGESIAGDVKPECWVPSGRSGPCYIASCVYSASAPEVAVLRAFRDEILLRSNMGRKLTEWYYQVAPSITPFFLSNGFARHVLRVPLNVLVVVARWIVANRCLRHDAA